MSTRLFVGASACALAAILCIPTLAAAAAFSPAEVVVTAQPRAPDIATAPSPAESIDAATIAATVNAVNVEDSLRYLPDILVRKRHPGDTQDPITTRTSGVGSSARSLIYADGVLLSALIGNNNGAASPRFGMVSPEEVSRIDVLYGPFAAAYPGNSIGAVVNITTRMPEHLEGSVTTTGSLDRFQKYSGAHDYPTGSIAAVLGDRIGPWRFWLSEDHSDTRGQPLTYATALVPAAASAAGTPVTGAYSEANRLGQPIVVLGALGLEHQVQDNAKAKLAYDLPGGASLTYTFGYFGQEDDASVQSSLRNAAGATVYSGALNINGHAYTVQPSAFDTGVYHLREDHVSQALALRSSPDRLFSWEAIATTYDYLTDTQRSPTTALPGGFAGNTPGTISRLDGTGWRTLDLRAAWKPFGAASAHAFSFGAHEDRFVFRNPKYTTADWVEWGAPDQDQLRRGQDRDHCLVGTGRHQSDACALTATLGLRAERWQAYGGIELRRLARAERAPTGAGQGRPLSEGDARVDACRAMAPLRQLRPRLPLPHGDGALPVHHHRPDPDRAQPQPETGAGGLLRPVGGADGSARAERCGCRCSPKRSPTICCPSPRRSSPDRPPSTAMFRTSTGCARAAPKWWWTGSRSGMA